MQRRVNARGHAPGGDDGGDVGGALITVLRVYYLVYPDVSDIRWQFSADVTLTHAWPTANSVPQLEVSADGVAWFSPDNVYQLGPAVFLGSYSGFDTAIYWRLLSAPDNVSNSGMIVVPESGNFDLA